MSAFYPETYGQPVNYERAKHNKLYIPEGSHMKDRRMEKKLDHREMQKEASIREKKWWLLLKLSITEIEGLESCWIML